MDDQDDYAEHGPNRRLPSLFWLALISTILAALCGGMMAFLWWAARSFGIDD